MTTHFVRPDVQTYLDMLAASPLPKFGAASVSDTRALIKMARPLVDLDPIALPVIRDVTIPGPSGAIPARLYDAREDRASGPVFVFFHGGGWTVGDVENYDPFCTEAAVALDLPVVSIDYRLAPEHPFPAGPDDCEAAARWIAGSPAELGLGVSGLVFSGDSAGGNLALVTALALRDKPATVPVVALAPYYPATATGSDWGSYRDFGEGYFLTAQAMKFCGDNYQPDPKSPRAAPLLADLAGLPPTMLTTASLDPLRDQGRAFAAKLIEAGVATTYREAKGNIHGFINFRKITPSSQRDTLDSLAVLKAMIAEILA